MSNLNDIQYPPTYEFKLLLALVVNFRGGLYVVFRRRPSGLTPAKEHPAEALWRRGDLHVCINAATTAFEGN